MKRSQYSAYENYILMCDKSRGFKASYPHFLNFSEVKKFAKQIASVGADTFTYEGNIYSKRITTSDAQRMLDSLDTNNKCDYWMFRLLATQLNIQL